jgi:glycosyltransferase involved in cell wall biosynthesis
MRVLVAHNFYRSDAPSGENAVVEEEISHLREAGVEVEEFTAHSDSLSRASARDKLRAGAAAIHSPKVGAELERRISRARPDVVHVHNVFPLLGPAVLRTATRSDIPVVQTVHNYRHSCVNGLHFREGRTCLDCHGRHVQWPALQHGCYQGSRPHTLPMVISGAANRDIWQTVARFIALTPFMRDHLVKQGLDPHKISLRPTAVEDLGQSRVPQPDAPLLYLGRLEASKGLELLLDSFALAKTSRELWIGGAGPMAGTVKAAASRDPRVRYLGALNKEGVADALKRSAAVVVPSLCLEGFPRVVAEAFAVGRPIVTVTGGSVESIVGHSQGWSVPPEKVHFGAALEQLTYEELSQRGEHGRRYYDRLCEPKKSLQRLLALYDSVANPAT